MGGDAASEHCSGSQPFASRRGETNSSCPEAVSGDDAGSAYLFPIPSMSGRGESRIDPFDSLLLGTCNRRLPGRKRMDPIPCKRMGGGFPLYHLLNRHSRYPSTFADFMRLNREHIPSMIEWAMATH